MPLILGIIFVAFGCAILLWLPSYQRKIDAGEAPANPSMPVKSWRLVGVGLVIFGLLSTGAWYFHLVDF